MDIREIRLLYDYNEWANARILAACARVSPQDFRAPTGRGFDSLRGTLAHMLDSESGWRTLFERGTTEGFEAVKEENFASPGELKAAFDREQAAMRDYLAGLSSEDLERHVRYTTEEGAERDRLLRHCLWHVVNHATHHRSEAAGLLRGYGCPPGELDFTIFLNEQAERRAQPA